MKLGFLKITPEKLPLISTAVICLALYVFACIRFDDFFSFPMTMTLLQDKAFLGVVAVGMTFVILTGGIDLSVGAAIGWVSIFFAALVMHRNVHPALAMPIVVLITTLFGAAMGAMIHFFKIPPFLITLAGLFFYRGFALVTSTDPIEIKHAFLFNFEDMEATALVLRESLGRGSPQVELRLEAWFMAATFLIAAFVAKFTSFGRSVYAIGGNEQSAVLMGLPVSRNKILVYAINGFCAGLAGLMSLLVQRSGDANRGSGLELDAIAAVVVGGTLLSGGAGSILGTFLGLLIVGIIGNIVVAMHFGSSAWPRIAIGSLLLAFILLQKLLQMKKQTSH